MKHTGPQTISLFILNESGQIYGLDKATPRFDKFCQGRYALRQSRENDGRETSMENVYD